MSIGVQSYPELYTVLMGWDLYDKLWELLTQTGIAYLPFIGLILKNVSQSYVMDIHHGNGFSLRSMEIQLLSMLLLVFFGAAPVMPLDAHTVSYTPICDKNNNTFHPGSTGTTYDNAFTIPTSDVRVPLWWYAVLSVSEGMTSAANTFVGCVPNLREMVTQVNMTQIDNSEMKQELQDFETMCYAKARAQYFKDEQDNQTTNLTRIQDMTNQYGVEDTEWLGSHALGEVYYPDLKSTRPVTGFPYDATDDINADINAAHPPAYGTPSCSDWWNDSQYGLKNRLYDVLPKSFYDDYKDYLDSEQTRDDLIKNIISKPQHDESGYHNANDMVGDTGYSHLAASVGIWYHQLQEYPKIYAAAEAAPIIQALLLLMVYVFLPFALVFSSYRASAFCTGATLVFSLIFSSFIWHLVSWTDKSLMEALYSNWFAKQGAGASLTDMIIGSLIIAAPLFWFLFMGALGVAVGHMVGGVAAGLHKVGNQAATDGAGLAQSAAKDIATAL
jgi:hypothetical protein